MSFRKIVAIMLILLVVLPSISVVLNYPIKYHTNIAYAQETQIYTGNATQNVLCYINTGTTYNVTFTESGNATTFIHEIYQFNTTLTLNAGNIDYNVTIPQGEYGNTSIVLAIADNMSYPGSGGRVSALFDAGHNNSISIIHMKLKAYFDAVVDGFVYYKVVVEWSNDTVNWNQSIIYINITNKTINYESNYKTIYAHGRYIRINATMIWAPASGNTLTTSAHGYLVLFIDSVVSPCFPVSPEAEVYYRVFYSYTNATITLPSQANATVDYIARDYNVSFRQEAYDGFMRVNISAPVSVSSYNLSFVLDEYYNPLPYNYDYNTGNLTVFMPIKNETIHIIYIKYGKTNTNNTLPENGFIWFYDFGDAIEQQASNQGWKNYTYYTYASVEADPTYNDYSLYTYVTTSTTYSYTGFYRDNLMLPPGDYYVGLNIKIDYRSRSILWGGYLAIYMFYHDNVTDNWNYTVLLSQSYGTTYTYDGELYGNFTTKNYGDELIYFIYGYEARAGSTTYTRWLYIISRSINDDYTVDFVSNTSIKYNTTSNIYGKYFLIMPYFTNNSVLPFDALNNTCYTSIDASSTINLTMKPKTSIKINITNMTGLIQYTNNTLITAPGENISITTQISAPIPQVFVYPDPVLSNTSVFFILLANNYTNTTLTTTNSTGVATANLIAPSSLGNATLVIAPTSWPYSIPIYINVIVDSVVVEFNYTIYYINKSSNASISFKAYYNISKLPFNGNITFNSSDITEINITNNPVQVINGTGILNITSGNISGYYNITAAYASVAGLLFNTSGNLTIVITGINIIINVYPQGPPWFLYSNITWTIYAAYDTGAQAYGNGSIIIEKDHYIIYRQAWNGTKTNITLLYIGYVNYLNATISDQLNNTYTNYSLVIAEPLTGGNNIAGGIQLMSFQVETLQDAALHDGFLVIAFMSLALLPFILRRYTRLFQGDIGLLLWTVLIFGLTLVTVAARSRIVTNAYIVQTTQGVTIKPVYTNNPFLDAYIAPLMIEILIMLQLMIKILINTINKITR